MATLNFNGPLAINMNVGDLVRFGTQDGNQPTNWSWITPEGTDIDLAGSGMTFDAGGHATGGTVNAVKIDVGNDGKPNIEIAGLNVGAVTLDDSPEAFWRAVLGGDDVINGPSVSETGTLTSQVFGDGTSLATGPNDGGDDFMTLGDASVVAVGDVTTVGSNGGFTGLNGGNDQICVGATDLFQQISGDANDVLGGGALFGGNDLIEVRTSNDASVVSGDADSAAGVPFKTAFVEGGDDRISGLDASSAQLIGDVGTQGRHSAVKGGADRIDGSGKRELISGDVGEIASATGQSFVGGNDTLNGNGGEDVISGDVLGAEEGAGISGGDDVIRGGADSDSLFGDIFGGDAEFVFPGFKGGNDLLFGDAGDDFLFGQTGNDRLSGDTGLDRVNGGSGRDRLAGGGDADVFVFAPGGDVDRVIDFENGVDRLDLSAFGFDRFGEVKAFAADTAGGDLRLAFGAGDVLVIDDFGRADFTAGDVLL